MRIKTHPGEKELPDFDYAKEQERFLRQAIGNELYEALDKITTKLPDYKAWWNGKR